MINNNLPAQLADAKLNVGPGWHWLLDILFSSFSRAENTWLKVKDQNRWEKSELPYIRIQGNQFKEKLGSARFYVSFFPVDHDWTKFDKDEYNRRFEEWNWNLYGQIAMLELISGEICEQSGERGKIRNINGWLKCLSDVEYSNAIFNEKHPK